MTSSGWNRAVKRWPGWLALLFAAVALVMIGGLRDDGPGSPEERAAAIDRTIRCPECQGESVYESNAPAAVDIRNQVRTLVDEGHLSDDEIVAEVSAAFGDLQMLPDGSGVNSLVWALPVAAAVAGAAGLVIAFRRWRMQSSTSDPTDADRQLVAAALVDARSDGD